VSQSSGKRAFIALSALAFAICFLVSEYGRARHLRWLGGWPPLLFVFTVPPEYRFRFATGAWARDVFIAMTTVTCTGLAIGVIVETLVVRSHPAAAAAPLPALPAALFELIPVVVLGGLLFGALSLFSAWGLFSVFYRPEGRGRFAAEKGEKNEEKGDDSGAD
jgi:hypothetical protein